MCSLNHIGQGHSFKSHLTDIEPVTPGLHTRLVAYPLLNMCEITIPLYMGNPKWVLLQTVKTHMKCRIMWHFIMVYTVCYGKMISRQKYTLLF